MIIRAANISNLSLWHIDYQSLNGTVQLRDIIYQNYGFWGLTAALILMIILPSTVIKIIQIMTGVNLTDELIDHIKKGLKELRK